MSVTTSSSRISYTGDGVTTVFAFPYLFQNNADIEVWVNNVQQTSGFTTTGASNAALPTVGGQVAFFTAPPISSSVELIRNPTTLQNTVLSPNDPFPAKTVETMVDAAMLACQRLNDILALQPDQNQLPVALSYPFQESSLSGTIPPAAQRALSLLAFDVNGVPTTASMPASVGAGNMTPESGANGKPGFKNGVDFTAGVTTTLTLSQDYGYVANTLVAFDALYVQKDSYILSGRNIIFGSWSGSTFVPGPIPAGVSNVDVIGGTTYSAVTIPPNSVGASQIVAGSVADIAINPSSVLYTHTYGWVGSKDKGATGNGTSDDEPYLALANSAAVAANMGLTFTPGSYLVKENITFTAPVKFMPGAQLLIANGVTVTFSNVLNAGIAQIFSISGSGAVVVNGAYTPIGYAEWWGAVTGNTSVDNSVPINACIVACQVTLLQGGTYYTVNPVLQQTAGRAVIGVFNGFNGNGGVGSFIKNQTATGIIYQIGPNTYPGSFQNTNVLKNVGLTRSVAPAMTAYPTALAVQYTIWSTIENVLAEDSRYCFHITGTGQTRMRSCFAERSVAGVGGTDQYYGFYLDGSVNVGGAGGNESVYLDNCSAGLAGATWSNSVDYQGLVASGAYGYSDIFIKNFETAGLGYALNFQGNSNSGSTPDIQNEDVRIYNVVADVCQIAGILFANTSEYGSIQVFGGYLEGASGAAACIEYAGSQGAIFVTGVEMLCNNAGVPGVVATNSKGMNHVGNQILQSTVTAIQLSGCTSCSFEDQVLAYGITTNSPAMSLSAGCARVVARLKVNGTPGAFSQGYYLSDSTTGYSEFNCSGLNSGAISQFKLDNNGSGVSSVGTFGTNNYASGVMA